MRRIGAGEILVFVILAALAAGLAAVTTWLLLGKLPLGDFRGVVLVGAGLCLLEAWALLVHRAFLVAFPLRPGDVPPGSRQEFVYHVYLLFFLVLFYPVMRSGAVPVPLMRLVYLALGARLGSNTYSSGIILDPRFVTIGDNSIIGQYALLVPHVIENERLAHFPIRVGSNVTVGAHAVVLSDVEIGDGAIVATGAVVPKGTRIAPGEVWGGVPARRLQHAGEARR